MKMQQSKEFGILPDSIEAAVKVLVHAKSIPETACVTHASSAFLPATREGHFGCDDDGSSSNTLSFVPCKLT